jgi:NADPH-dependent 2,4-dienoyl-CoA reductase/sulfur reductase-like enzyme
MAAAGVLARHGLRPLVLDEAAEAGGQVWRRIVDDAFAARLLGREMPKYQRAHSDFASWRDRMDYRADTLAWAVSGDTLHLVSAGQALSERFDALILATGATDRLLPIRGWTTPGVYSLGGAQALLKGQGCAIGRRVVFCGSSPLLYLAAVQYALAGAEVAAVLDTTPYRRKLAAGPRLLGGLPTLWRGISYMNALRRRGIPIIHGVRLQRILGASRVEGIAFSAPGAAEEVVACDAVGLGFGLRPETQLAELAGATLRFDPVFRQWLPQADLDGRCGGSIYAAGDGCAIGGADAAEVSGALAAYAVLADAGRSIPEREIAGLRRRLLGYRRFQQALATAFAWPAHWMADIADDVPLCRCERVTVGEIRQALHRELGPRELNRGKAITRCGMGRCQGRYCGLAAAELISTELSLPLEQVGRLRAQAPVKPLSAAMVGE